jgi:hypothetical protein
MATNPAADALGSQLVLQAQVGTLVIDQTPPRVRSVRINRRTGQILITFVDPLAGFDPATLLDASGYSVASMTRQSAVPQLITSVLSLGPTTIAGSWRIALVLNGRQRLRASRYSLTIRSSVIQDRAGLALDGAFRGRLPSGNGSPGSDFMAVIESDGRLAALHGSKHRTSGR